MFERILVAVDSSRHSKRAVDTAIDVARCYESSVFLLHVIRDVKLPKEIVDMIKAGEITASRTQILEDSAQIILDNAREKFEAAGISGVKGDFILGDPAFRIADYAEKNDVDLIVIGHRGLGTRGQMLGSVARKLLNMTEITCLVVR